MSPFRCPVCIGTGLVSLPPGVAGDQREYVSSSAGPWPCRACGGTGLVWGPGFPHNSQAFPQPFPGDPSSPMSPVTVPIARAMLEEEYDKLLREKPICSQCGQAWGEKPCGLAHLQVLVYLACKKGSPSSA